MIFRPATSDQRLGVKVSVQFARKAVSFIFHGTSATTPEPSAMAHGRSAIIPEASATVHGRSAITPEPSAMIHEPSATSHGRSATIPEPSAIAHETRFEFNSSMLTLKTNIKWPIM